MVEVIFFMSSPNSWLPHSKRMAQVWESFAFFTFSAINQKWLLLFLLLLPYKQVFGNEQYREAKVALERSDLLLAIPLFIELSDTLENEFDRHIYVNAQLGLAEAYTDLGTYHLSNRVLHETLNFLRGSNLTDHLIKGRIHQLLADNYDLLFRHDEFLYHTEKFIEHYRKTATSSTFFEAIYHSYLGRYYNLKFLIDQAYFHTSKSIELFHSSTLLPQRDEVVKLYENHCLTLRNHVGSDDEKYSYQDTLRQVLNRQFPYPCIKKAKALISLTSMEMDDAFNSLSDPENTLTQEEKNLMIQSVTEHYDAGINMFKALGFEKHDYLPRYYDLQAWLHYGSGDYTKALELIEAGIDTYPNKSYLKHGVVSNSYRMMASLRLKALLLLKMNTTTEDLPENERKRDFFALLENLWEVYFLEIVQQNSDFVTEMYNQNPYQYLFHHHARNHLMTSSEMHLEKAHEYEEKSRYSGLLTIISLTENDKVSRSMLFQQKEELNFQLDLLYEAKLLKKNRLSLLKTKLEKSILSFNQSCKSSSFHYDDKIPSIEQLQNNLAPGEALLSYYYVGLGNHRLYAKLITSKSAVIFPLDAKLSSDLLKEMVDTLQTALENHDIETFKNVSHNLYKLLFAPVEEKMHSAIDKVHILPFAEIEPLSFDLLIEQNPNSADFRNLPYLVKRYYFSYGLSATVSFLNLIENECFEHDLAIYTPTLDSYKESNLEYAQAVGANISKAWNAPYFTDDATEKNFARSLTNTQVVIIMSHGNSSSDLNAQNKTILFQDGFMSMDEVYELEVNSQFVVLTACETGVGFRDRGEGSIGLVRAFAAAGARSVLSAKWAIDETTSLNILSGMFKHLKNGCSRSKALNLSKNEHLARCVPREGNPIYWAGMNIVGDHGPIDFLIKNPDGQVAWSGLLIIFTVLIVLTIGFVMKKYR